MFFIKFMGFSAIGASLSVWWWMIDGLIEGKIEATTKGSIGEIWYSRADMPTPFWVVVAVHFCIGLLFFWLGYIILRKEEE